MTKEILERADQLIYRNRCHIRQNNYVINSDHRSFKSRLYLAEEKYNDGLKAQIKLLKDFKVFVASKSYEFLSFREAHDIFARTLENA